MNMNMNRFFGALAVVVAAVHVGSLSTMLSRSYPVQHVLGIMALYTVLFPFLLLTNPAWYSFPMQLMVMVMITALDWFSFHEDVTRFSEAEICAVAANCRENGRVTGHLAHWMDVLGLGMIVWPQLPERNWRYVLIAALSVYGIVGSLAIERYQRPGGYSDLRGMEDDEKCKHARVMSSVWRGGVNDIITVLGIMAVWQTIYAAPMITKCSEHKIGIRRACSYFNGMSAARLILELLMIAGPQYANYLNTSYQHGLIKAADYKLPDCFDDVN